MNSRLGRHLVQNQKFIIVVEGINKNKTTWGVFKKITKLCSTPINIFYYIFGWFESGDCQACT